MKVAIISPEFPPLTNWGGIATFNYHLAKMLVRMGHKVEVITYNDKSDDEVSEIDAGIRINYVGMNLNAKVFGGVFRGLRQRFPSLIFMFLWGWRAKRRFDELHSNDAFDVIHSHVFRLPTLFLIKSKVKVILHLHGPQWMLNKFESWSWDHAILGLLEKWIIRFSKCVICPSELVMRRLVSDVGSVKHKVVIIPNIINDATSLRSKLSTNNIVYWGRLDYRKGVDRLVRAYSELAGSYHNMELFLIGEEGNNFPYMGRAVGFSKYLELMGLDDDVMRRIHIYRRINNRNELHNLLGMIKGIAVFPSRYDPFGYSVVEAMMMGNIVVVSSRVGSADCLIKDGKDGFVGADSIEDIKSIVSSLIRKDKIQLEEISMLASDKKKWSEYDRRVRSDYQMIFEQLDII